MDTLIAGILIIVVTGVLVAVVRASTTKPRPPMRVPTEADFVDADIMVDSLHRTLSDLGGSDPIGVDLGH